MTPGLQKKDCVNHPGRFGHALCMSCRNTVCQECATVWDGINYCTKCLGKVRRQVQKRPGAPVWIFVLLVAAILYILAPKAMVWGATALYRLLG